ncbi:MAG: FtsX-like permease family protein, partial [Acutalibacter muris]|nr:FtsX-like permease family protein [Acutalibacter muris]
LRGRVHETGVYLAMGISKGSVLLQYLLEVILAAAIALLLSYGVSSAISNQIGSRLLSQVTTETYEAVDLTGNSESGGGPAEDLGLSEIIVAVSAKDYLTVWAFGMVLCTASTALAAYPVMKMKPKSILSQMS